MEKQMKTTKFYTIDQVADALGVSTRSVRRTGGAPLQRRRADRRDRP